MERKTVMCLRKQNNKDKKRVKVRDEGLRDRRRVQRAAERERETEGGSDGGRRQHTCVGTPGQQLIDRVKRPVPEERTQRWLRLIPICSLS